MPQNLRSEMVTFSIANTFEPGRAFVAYPEGDGPHPGVLVLHEILGLNDDMERVARRFASQGYVAMAPDFFGPGLQIGCIIKALKSLNKGEGEAFVRLSSAQDWLIDRHEVDAERIGTVGFCMGGGFALLHAAREEVHVVANYYGDVPKKADKLEGIPACFGGFGAKDKLFAPKAKVLKAHLDELDVANEIVTYTDAGHSYMSNVEGVLARIGAKSPMKVGYDPTSAEDSWTRMLAFFSEHLTGKLIVLNDSLDESIDLTTHRTPAEPAPSETDGQSRTTDTPTA